MTKKDRQVVHMVVYFPAIRNGMAGDGPGQNQELQQLGTPSGSLTWEAGTQTLWAHFNSFSGILVGSQMGHRHHKWWHNQL